MSNPSQISDWMHDNSPIEMLRYLDGKIADEAFMHFSAACCRRIWTLISDPRSRAVVEATEAFLIGSISAQQAAQITEAWARAFDLGEISDGAGGISHEAIESVFGLGRGHAAQVSLACAKAAGYAASEPLRIARALQKEITEAWQVASEREQVAHCQLLRQLFGEVVRL